MRASRLPRLVASLLTLGLAAGALSACGQPESAARVMEPGQARAGCLASRHVMEAAEHVMRLERPAPASAARFYAYVASAYADAVDVASQASAARTAVDVIGVLYPQRRRDAEEALRGSGSGACRGLARTSAPGRADVLRKYESRSKFDGSDSIVTAKAPAGPGIWAGKGVKPATPAAGDWARWAVKSSFAVPPPPRYGGPQDKLEMAKVKAAVAARDGQWVAKINFWGGVPGTDTPAGIWQNQLYAVLARDLGKPTLATDRAYARTQAMLAQVLADAFMECWKAKFAYWTARPSERIPNLDLAMENPPFPAYPSGHAAVSAAAAEVLAVLAPRHGPRWQAMSRDAADSRLYAGIHFEVDTIEGANLGASVGQEFVREKKLEAVWT